MTTSRHDLPTPADEAALRREIYAAGDRSPVQVDLDEVLAAGHRGLGQRRRRRAALAGSLAALGLVAGSVAVAGTDHSQPQPASSPSPVVVQTGTLEGMALPLRLTARREADGAIRLQVSGDPQQPGAAPANLQLAPAQQVVHTSSVPTCRGCELVAVRGHATWLDLAASPALGAGWSSGAPAWLGEAGLTVQVFVPSEGRGRLDGMPVRWRLADGSVHAGQGQLLASVALTDPRGKHWTMYTDPATKEFGAIGEGDSLRVAQGAAPFPGADDATVQPGDASAVRTITGLLPVGSRLLAVTLPDGKAFPIASAPLPGAGTAFVGSLAVPKTAPLGKLSYRWRAADGSLHTTRS